jgi:hypothetical protein
MKLFLMLVRNRIKKENKNFRRLSSYLRTKVRIFFMSDKNFASTKALFNQVIKDRTKVSKISRLVKSRTVNAR